MDIETLREHTCAHLLFRHPELKGGAGRMVDECLASARKSFRDAFICQLSPQAWAGVTLIYFKHFLDTGCDVSIGEIFAAVIRDSIGISRMDMLTLELAQRKLDELEHAKRPTLTVVRDR